MNVKLRTPTAEEYKKDKELILEAYKKGLPMRRMMVNFGYTRTYIIRIKEVLIKEGKLTESEIEIASNEYYKGNPMAQGLDKSRVRKEYGTEKYDRRHNACLKKKEQVFELVKQKYIKARIAKELGMTETAVDFL